MKEVLADDFASFFNIEKQKTKKGLVGQKEIHYKTGGFKEYIDLYLTVNKSQRVVAASIEVDYQFIEEKGMLAIDVIKSFIQDFCHEADAAVCETLAMRLFKREGEVAEELSGTMGVLESKKKWDATTLKKCVLNTETRAKRIVFSYHWINWTEQPVSSKSFMSNKLLAPYQLTSIQKESSFYVWQNKNEATVKVPFERLVDGRWQFATEAEAINYYRAYQLKQSEGMQVIQDWNKKLGDQYQVYESNKKQEEMLAMLGITDSYYCFLVRRGAKIAKIFVVITADGKLEEATEMVIKGVKKM
jgi:hypothetical protein